MENAKTVAEDDDFTPLDLEKSTGFDASPSYDRPEMLSRRPTRMLEPRSPISRITSSRTENRNFTHALSQQKTDAGAIVDFEGKDDPYRPMNWSQRKKVIIVVLYGFTTMCSSWNTSIYAGLRLFHVYY